MNTRLFPEGLKYLSDRELRECRFDARAMVAKPENGVAEYRMAIIREENRRFFARRNTPDVLGG